MSYTRTIPLVGQLVVNSVWCDSHVSYVLVCTILYTPRANSAHHSSSQSELHCCPLITITRMTMPFLNPSGNPCGGGDPSSAPRWVAAVPLKMMRRRRRKSGNVPSPRILATTKPTRRFGSENQELIATVRATLLFSLHSTPFLVLGRKLELYVALWDYEKSSGAELSFVKGEIFKEVGDASDVSVRFFSFTNPALSLSSLLGDPNGCSLCAKRNWIRKAVQQKVLDWAQPATSLEISSHLLARWNRNRRCFVFLAFLIIADFRF